MLGQKSSEKVPKNVLIFTRISSPNNGGKNARNNLCRSTRIERAKNVGKKLFEKSAKKRFLYPHEYHAQKMGGKKTRNNFSRTTQIVRAIYVGTKFV